MPKGHRDYFNRMASDWNEKMGDNPMFPEYLKQFGISRGNRVLDIGAGTGRMTRYIVELVGSEGWVAAEDIAERMLLEGKKLFNRKNAFWICDDVFRLAFKNGVFDKALCFSAFPHFIDPIASLHEMNRVLVPGGRLLILHVSSSQQLNAFHADLESPVNRDRLPQVREMEPMLKESGFLPVRMVEKEDLYWVEGVKTA
jgi:ubiquinone/menaquinone biosynthesis C-methylase UbiE